MTRLSLTNHFEIMLCVWVEPWGEDFWIAPRQQLHFATSDGHSDADCIWHDQGVSVYLTDAAEVVVTTEDGEVVECGYQGPGDAFAET